MQTIKKIKNSVKKIYIVTSLYALCLLFSSSLLASDMGSDMPWEGPLQKILDAVSGPVAKALGVIVIILAGFGLAFGESGSGVKKLLQVVFGLSIAFTAGSLVTSLFGASSGMMV